MAPDESPATRCFCAMKEKMITGRITKMPDAVSPPQSTPESPALNAAIITGNVCVALLVSTAGNRKSFKQPNGIALVFRYVTELPADQRAVAAPGVTSATEITVETNSRDIAGPSDHKPTRWQPRPARRVDAVADSCSPLYGKVRRTHRWSEADSNHQSREAGDRRLGRMICCSR